MTSRQKGQDQLMDAQRILINPLNVSVSKQQFSFPRAQRWPRAKTEHQNYQFYDIPTTKSRIATTIGTSQRRSLSKQLLTPSPNQYNYIVEGEFGASKTSEQKSSKGFGFGIGRQQAKTHNFLRMNSQSPSPVTYNPPKIPHRDLTFSKEKRIRRETSQPSSIGPAAYQVTSTLIEGKQILSNHHRNPSPKIQEIKLDNRKKKDVKAPPLYNIRVTSKGDKLDSQRRGFRIGTSKRLREEKSVEVPGPGRYKVFSEFISKGKS